MINFTNNLQWGKKFIIRLPVENILIYIKVIGIDHMMTNSAIVIFAIELFACFLNVRKLFFLLSV